MMWNVAGFELLIEIILNVVKEANFILIIQNTVNM